MGRPQRIEKQRGESPPSATQRRRPRARSLKSPGPDDTLSYMCFDNSTTTDVPPTTATAHDDFGLQHLQADNIDFQNLLDPQLTEPDYADDDFLTFAADSALETTFDFPFHDISPQDKLLPYPTPAAEKPTIMADFHNEDKSRNMLQSIASEPRSSWPDVIRAVSQLNLEAHQQRGIMSTISAKCVMTDVATHDTSNCKSLFLAATFMVQGLQKYHEILKDAMSLKDESASSSNQAQITTEASNHLSNSWLNLPSCSATLLSLNCDRVNDCLPQGQLSPEHPRTGLSSSHIDAQISREHQQTLRSTTPLDIPTSLLLISCYISLIHLCQEVFAAIRKSMSSTNYQSKFAEFVKLDISGISLHEDPEIQVVVLTQAVIRLVDRIGHSLGYPYLPKGDGQYDGTDSCIRRIHPQLLDFVLRQDENDGPLSMDRKGIEALKNEIRLLNTVVYKLV